MPFGAPVWKALHPLPERVSVSLWKDHTETPFIPALFIDCVSASASETDTLEKGFWSQPIGNPTKI